jgi:pSer/pThr/pTyr-binding forkhead associated (FHA) protein
LTDFVFIEEAPIEGLERPAAPGLTIGRAETDVELNDPDVSREHAIVRRVDEGIAVEDLGSTNGTYVNDGRIRGIAEVKAGDRVRFGNTVWRLERVSASGAGDREGAGEASGSGLAG